MARKRENMEIQDLTACEQLIMKTVWDAEKELGLAEVTRRVNATSNKDWKPQTVSTFLTRLVKKGYLQSYREGRIFFYRSLVTQEDYVGEMAERFIAFWHQGSVESFLASLEKRRAK